ncbi:OLC1v1029387C1 [Oldenlandia corymbosa var. corymbosa]|uniref:OLC1v1029387C1 n=1 Tax=Oldenlandia corymbosa var. corymbosa TaxID=529605 RepID=A0AAV1CGU6_OLDCO|nr:OLC1v1029387C1 [Oldenlandia corymbosa var. corymbosa]
MVFDLIMNSIQTSIPRLYKMSNVAQAALLISILIISSFWFLVTIFKKTKKRSFPPGPWGLPIVGYLPFLKANMPTQFAELAQKYGPIFKFRLGNKLCVVLSSPSLVKEITRDQDVVFANRDATVAAEVLTFGGYDIAWTAYGSYWRNMRKVFVREILSGSNLDACYDLRKDEVIKAIEYVGMNVGKPVRIDELAFQTELNVILRMLWGGTHEANQKSEKAVADFRVVFAKIVNILGKPNISDFFPILRWFDIQGVAKEAHALLQVADSIVDAVINERVKMAEDSIKTDGIKKDFLQILLELKKLPDTGEDITMLQRKAILMDIVVGGTDTTATMIEWAMAEVLHNREAMEKVQKELDDVIGLGNIVEEFHLPKLHYLEAVVKEALRLHPAIPLLVPRRPSKSSIVGGYTVPENTSVFVNAWAIQRDPELWDDPLQFKPERFLMESKNGDYNGNNFQYIPFGSGRRMCAGIPLAEKMVKYILASLFHSFDWKPTTSKVEDLSEKFDFVLRKRIPLLAIPTKRTRKQY